MLRVLFVRLLGDFPPAVVLASFGLAADVPWVGKEAAAAVAIWLNWLCNAFHHACCAAFKECIGSLAPGGADVAAPSFVLSSGVAVCVDPSPGVGPSEPVADGVRSVAVR